MGRNEQINTVPHYLLGCTVIATMSVQYPFLNKSVAQSYLLTLFIILES